MPDAAAALSPGTGTDAIQAAIVVLELWLGRRVKMRDVSARLPVLIREACERCATVMPASALELWLRRALAVDGHGYRDAADAFEELIRIPDWPRPADRARALHDLATTWRLHTDGADLPRPATMREGGNQSDADARPPPVTTTVATMAAPVSRDIEEKRPRRFERTARAGVAAFCLVALVAAVATAVSRRSISRTIETPPSPVAAIRVAAVKPSPSPALVVPPPVSVPLASPVQPVIDQSRRGTIRPAVAGRPRAIAGTPAPQAPPDAAPTASPEQATGVAHFNAIPWANISIDGQPQGQTPLGNVTLPVGSHEVTFAHPDLGTVRRTIVVTADRPTRLSVTLGGEP